MAPDASGLSDDGLCVRVEGSPELKSKLVFTAQIGRTKKTFTLVPTGGDDAPHAEEAAPVTQRPKISDAVDTGGPYASAEELAEDGDIPGRGPKSGQGELA